MLQIRRMLQLLQEGRSKRQISKDLSISCNTIDDYELKYIASGQSLVSLLELSDSSLWEVLNPPDRSEKESIPGMTVFLKGCHILLMICNALG